MKKTFDDGKSEGRQIGFRSGARGRFLSFVMPMFNRLAIWCALWWNGGPALIQLQCTKCGQIVEPHNTDSHDQFFHGHVPLEEMQKLPSHMR